MPALMLAVFGLTLFVSATLLFIIELMVGKMITPLLGGTPAVWATCMVFYQAALLAGYAYAHAATTWLGPRKQALLQLGLLALPFLFLSRLNIDRSIATAGVESPIVSLLILLTTTIGVPFFVVSSSAPVLQKWFADTDNPAASDPYFLYGASNFGSMLALFGYPIFIEPYFTLRDQRMYWSIGYGILVLFTFCCAMFLAKSPPPSPGLGVMPRQPETKDGAELDSDVTPGRRVRWVLLAAVPSSLMLGVTTYITTDIAAIPLLWVAPLGIYLLTFIIVFGNIGPWGQGVIVWLKSTAILAGLGYFAFLKGTADVSKGATFLQSLRHLSQTTWVLMLLLIVAAFVASFLLLKNQRDNFLHRVMILAMPLAVLLVLFITLASEAGNKLIGIGGMIALHLLGLYVVAMVCHGELARDRPSTAHLTEYFLWMSFGGVVGGLTNALVAPVVFNAIVEYQLAMVFACLLLPPLSTSDDKDGEWGVWADVGLAVAFALTGLVLIYLRLRDRDPDSGELTLAVGELTWLNLRWPIAAILASIVAGAVWALRGKPQQRATRWLDLVLPLSLGVLVAGLYVGLISDAVYPRIKALASAIPERFEIGTSKIRLILMFGLPAVLCYTFVERSMRFGLSVGALLLVAAICHSMDDPAVHQVRSFFGVLKVEEGREYGRDFRSLVHGTTLHGKQYVGDEHRGEALTYYHKTGPIGRVLSAYNQVDRPVGVIGLGTGTLATYALPGQTFTFYDIDPHVLDISYKTDKYFSFVKDAEARGAKLSYVLGDARLTLANNKLQGDDRYGILAVDAFSSDAIPVHLMNLEALQMMLEKIRDDGIILFHVSNRYLNLKPVVARLAEKTGLVGYYMDDHSEKHPGKTASTWCVLARKREYLDRLLLPDRWQTQREETQNHLALMAALPDYGMGLAPLCLALGSALEETKGPWKILKTHPKVGVWTDDYSNLLSVFGLDDED